ANGPDGLVASSESDSPENQSLPPARPRSWFSSDATSVPPLRTTAPLRPVPALPQTDSDRGSRSHPHNAPSDSPGPPFADPEGSDRRYSAADLAPLLAALLLRVPIPSARP